MSAIRGEDRQPDALFSNVSAEERASADHHCAPSGGWSMACRGICCRNATASTHG